MATEQHNTYLFTSESVTEGHPDKICDQISDAILDAILAKEIQLQSEGYVAPDGHARRCRRKSVARARPMVTTGLAIVAGEIRTQACVDVQSIVRDDHHEHRLRPRQVRLRRQHLRRPQRHPRAEPRHRHGRRRIVGDQAGRRVRGSLREDRRGRPGHDVRLRLRRDQDPHADADLPGAAHVRAPGAGPQGRHAAVICVPTARRR